ncbi:MAG: Lrp/AsnC family transcriptional regulator [Pseudomonadota bacterium]
MPPPRKAAPIVLDDTDRRIIARLKVNGRATNQDIARALGIAATTVSARIRRLERARALSVIAVADFKALDLNVLLAVGIEVEGRPAQDVGAELATLPEVFSVHLVTGARDIEALVAVPDLAALKVFIEREIVKIKGIRRMTAGIAVDIVKYNFDMAPIT